MAMVVAFIVVVLLAVPSAHAATQHVVGGSSGWTNSLGDYTSWASGQTFTVGDTLLFNYDTSTHSVAQVPKTGYDGCTASNAINTYSDGSTTIPLTNVSSMYFICPTVGHCSSGMKLAINVVAASSSTTPSPPATTPSTTSSPPPPPLSKSGAAAGNAYSVMLGSLLLLGTLVVSLS